MASITKFIGRVGRIYCSGVMAAISVGICEITGMLVDRKFGMTKVLETAFMGGITGLYWGYMEDILIDEMASRYWEQTYKVVHKIFTVDIWTNVYWEKFHKIYTYFNMYQLRSSIGTTPPIATGPVTHIHAPIATGPVTHIHAPTGTTTAPEIRDTVIDNEDQLIM